MPKKKKYIMYTTQGYTEDPMEMRVENMQVLDIFESDKGLRDAAEDAKTRMKDGEYGYFTAFIIREISDDYIMKAIK